MRLRNFAKINLIGLSFFIFCSFSPLRGSHVPENTQEQRMEMLAGGQKRQIRKLQKQISKLERELEKLQSREKMLAHDEELLKKEAWAEAGRRKKRRNPNKIRRREQRILDKLTAKRQELKIQQDEIAGIQSQIGQLAQKITVLSDGKIAVPVIQKPSANPVPLANIDRSLDQEIKRWIGTPYRYGGSTATGVDCSGLVGNIYRSVYAKNLPRTSADMYRVSKKVKRAALKKGDLVFFKIRNSRVNHVGIYLGDNQFVHASTSRGVMISSLNEAYFQRYFIGGGRI